MVMDLNASSNTTDHGNNFEFAFNSSKFSDRILRIEIVASADEFKEDGGYGISSGWARHQKRKKEDRKKEKVEYGLNNSHSVMNRDQPGIDDCVAYEDSNVEAVAMMESPTVKLMHINSAILAAKSSFFYKLFSNGMLESDQKQATLRIKATEETALMELLYFMYSGKLSITEAPHILDVFMAADKFEVPSCMRHCTQLLKNQQITTESAMLYLDLPCSISKIPALQPLIDSAKRFLADKYGDIIKCFDEVMYLPLAAIEAILSSSNLQVQVEDTVFDFVLRWSGMHYPNLVERHKILESHLVPLVRFPYMSCRKLRKVLECYELKDQEFIYKAVMEALFFKAAPRHRQRALIASGEDKYIERLYGYRPIKVLEFESPFPQCTVYLELKKEECGNLYPDRNACWQAFHFCGHGFFLCARCNMDQQGVRYCFGLYLGMKQKGEATFTVDLEFDVIAAPSYEYVSKFKGKHTFVGGAAVGCRNLVNMDWDSFMSVICPYFTNDVLHVKAELTVKKPIE